MTDLIVAPCGYDAARHAVTRWHYSRRMPVGRQVAYGVWEDGAFTGAVIFSRGANQHLAQPYGLTAVQACELTRIALRSHKVAVSQMISRAVRQLRAGNPGLRLIISFADPEHGHHGGIYQAANWIYTGTTEPGRVFRIGGRLVHERTLSPTQMGRATGRHQSLAWIRANLDPDAEAVSLAGKHRYLYPLDKAVRRQLAPLAERYPERAAEVSMATRPASGGESEVQALGAAPS